MIYQHKNSILDINGSKGYFYIDNNLRFVGDGYKAILMFIQSSNNNKNVIKQFKNQLNQREVCKLSKRNNSANESV